MQELHVKGGRISAGNGRNCVGGLVRHRLAGAHEGDVALHVVLDLLLLAIHRLDDVVELRGRGIG